LIPLKKDKVTFTHITVDNGKDDRHKQILAHANGEIFPVANFHSTKEMFNKGLEMNFKPLANMSAMAEGLAELLTTYANISHVKGSLYSSAMTAYSPFIDKYLTYDAFKRKVDATQDQDGWI
jgi:hypothetical protein